MDDDFERRTWTFRHPHLVWWRGVAYIGTCVCLFFILVAAATMATSADALFESREPVERLDCAVTRAECIARLPEAYQALPDPELVRAETHNRAVRAAIADGAFLRDRMDLIEKAGQHGSAESYASISDAMPSLLVHHFETSVPPITVDGWLEALPDVTIAHTEPVEIPFEDPVLRSWVEHVAQSLSEREMEDYIEAVGRAISGQFVRMERENQDQVEAWGRHRARQRNAWLGIASAVFGSLGILGVVGVLLRIRRLADFEVKLDRHTLDVRGERVPVHALSPRETVQLLEALYTTGHEIDDPAALERALLARVSAARAGEPTVEERAALVRLLGQTHLA